MLSGMERHFISEAIVGREDAGALLGVFLPR
jgi:hypothetical protein